MEINVHNYFIRQIKAFEKHYAKTKHSFDVEAIHQMRLSIKRIKALFQLLEMADAAGFSAKEEFRQLRLLFKLSGNIRDVQVQRELEARFGQKQAGGCTGYRNHLQTQEKHAVDAFNKELEASLLHDSVINTERVQQMINGVIHDKGFRIKALALLNQKIAAIDSLRNNLSEEENVHKIRITLKQIHYIIDVMGEAVPLKLFLAISLKQLKKIETVFGQWHDMVNAVVFLKDYLRSSASDEAADCKALLADYEGEKALLFDRIKKILNKDLIFRYVLEM